MKYFGFKNDLLQKAIERFLLGKDSTIANSLPSLRAISGLSDLEPSARALRGFNGLKSYYSSFFTSLLFLFVDASFGSRLFPRQNLEVSL